MSKARGGGGVMISDGSSGMRQTSTQHEIDVALVHAALGRQSYKQITAVRLNRTQGSKNPSWEIRELFRDLARTLALSPWSTLSPRQRIAAERVIRNPDLVARIIEEHTARARIVEPYGPLPKRPPSRIPAPEGPEE